MSDFEGEVALRGRVAPNGAPPRGEGVWPCPPRDFSPDELLELVSAGSDWIWETDAELRFSWLSENYEQVTGIAPDKVIGRFRFDFLEQVSQGSPTAAAHLEDLQARRPFRNFVYEVRGARDDCRWVSTTGFPRFAADGAFLGYRGIGRNATAAAASFAELQKMHGRLARQEELAGEQSKALLSDLERAMDTMSMGVVLVDADLNTLIINRAYRTLSKIAPDEAPVGSPFRLLMETIRRHNGVYDVGDDKWETYVASRLAEIRAGDVAPREFAHADGHTMMYQVTALSGGKRLISYYDVTQMKNREVEFARALERSRLAETVVNSVKDPIFIKDEDLRFVFVNEAFAALFDKQPEDMLGRLGSDFLPADEAATFEASERQVLATGERYEVEEDFDFRGIGRSRMVRKNRVSIENGKQYVACFVFDITEMKRRENEAEAARQHLANVLDSLPAGVIIYDADDKFIFANKMLRESLPALLPMWQPGCTFRQALTFGHSVGYFRSSGDPAVDALYDADPDAWLDGMIARYHLPQSVFERLNADGRWFKVFDNRTADGTFIGVRVEITEMKRRETEAQEARNRLAEVLESMPAGIIIYDRDDRFVLANRKLKDAMPALASAWVPGAPLREVLKASHAAGYDRDSGDAEVDALYDTDPEAWIEKFASRYHVRNWVAERRNQDGRWFQATNMRTDDGTFIGVRADITELKERESALRLSMRKIELFRHVLDELPVAAFIKSDDLTIEFVNKAWSEITGIANEEAVGRTDRQLFRGDEAEGFADCDTHVTRTGEGLKVEEPITHRDGTVRQLMTRKSRLVASDGSVHLVGSSTDITEVKAREGRLQESLRENEIFRNLIDNVPVSIYAKREDLRLIYVNKYWTELTGCSYEDGVGKTDVEIFGANGVAFMEGDLAVLRSGKSQEIDETLTEEDGSVRYRIARKSSLVASDGTLYLLGSTIDVTELKEREKELREAQSRAVLADRAKSEFLANMSHEIRTPMNGVLGMAELLAKSELDPKQRTFTEIIVKSGNALLTIINDILDFSKIDAGQLVLDPAPFKLAEAIEDVATLISTRAKEKDLELIVRIQPGLHDLYVGDVGRIRQIITNLIGNAVKFTESGHVLVDVSGEPLGSSTRLRVAVTDTGIGIPAAKLGLVFEKFSQVDGSSTRRHEGTGLGLAITSRLVALMGGDIGVESSEGEGSTFWFTVTLPQAGRSELRRVTPLDVTGARILVVDDNAVNRAILTEQMAAWTFDSCAAESGPEGLQVLLAAAACGLSVDCMVLDYQMPGMTGAEMARIVRSTPAVADTPIVILTSVDQSLSNTSYRDIAIDAQLIKPARSSVLLETLVSTIQKHRASQPEEPAHEPAAAEARIWRPGTSVRAEPAIGAALRSPARPQVRSGADDGHRIDILVAEDNEVNQLVFTQILGETDYSFEIVGNGKLAVKAFGDMNPRMILMDVSMPEMNGLEATGVIRQREQETGRHVPIIGVTAHALKGDRERCLEAGMDDYLPKPISPRALLEKVERWAWQGAIESRDAG
jgi:PAS domain S-box-containing protein